MDPAQLFTASRVLIVAGKGGVGKTTVSATVARAAADAGLDVLLIELEGKSGLSKLFGVEPLDYREIVLTSGRSGKGSVRGRALTPDDALLEYLENHGLNRIARRLVSSGALEMVAAATPGIKDVLVLGKIKQLERDQVADLIVVDAPAAGHAIQFLRSAHGVLDAVNVGPIQVQAAEVVELITDAERCEVMLVTLPEETPVNELIQTGFSLEDDVGVSLAPVVVNGVYKPILGETDPRAAAAAAGVNLSDEDAASLAAAVAFRGQRHEIQVEQLERLARDLPLPQLQLPFLFTTDVGAGDLDTLVDALLAGIDALEAPTATASTAAAPASGRDTPDPGDTGEVTS